MRIQNKGKQFFPDDDNISVYNDEKALKKPVVKFELMLVRRA